LIVVFDSSVWISAFQFGGTPLQALDRISGRSTIAVCSQILNEVNSILKSKFNWPQENIEDALSDYARDIFICQVRGRLRGICRDPNDDMILECAVEAQADLIVSGDKDLLTLKQYKGVRILTPRAFLEEIS
jgi:putative PIN family toxin of toxin-antitoxin system